MFHLDAEARQMFYINLLTGENEIQAINDVVQDVICEEDREIVLEVLEKLLDTSTHRFVAIVTDMLCRDNVFKEFDFVGLWLLERVDRSEDYTFAILTVLCNLILEYEYDLPKYIKKHIKDIKGKYRRELLRNIVMGMDLSYIHIRERIARIHKIVGLLFNHNLKEILENNRDITDDMFSNWKLSAEDIIHIICNCSASFRDNPYSDRLINALRYQSYDEEGDHTIEDSFYKMIQVELREDAERIRDLTYTELIEDISERWDVMDILERIAYGYYVHVNYEETLSCNLLIDAGIRKTYALIFFYFVHIEKDIEDEDEMYKINKMNLGNKNMSIIDRLCGD